MKTAIVCEGGGMRGSYTAGVLQAFMEQGFGADELVGVSAGASNGVSYVSGQQQRGYRTNVDYAGDKRYAGLGNYLRTGSFFGMDFIFGEIPNRLDPFDYEAFAASPCLFFAGATDVETGRPFFFAKQQLTRECAILKASCSIPCLSPIVEIEGKKYLDGGVAAPIPIEKALADGCERLVVVLTRHRGYVKKPQGFKAVYHQMYRRYPNLVKALDMRHLVYNHTLQKLWRLEAEGKAVVVAPKEPLLVDRFGKNREALAEAYRQGLQDGLAALAFL
ncbi:MAG: patatin family protein [Oscillospiraceae bacterium]